MSWLINHFLHSFQDRLWSKRSASIIVGFLNGVLKSLWTNRIGKSIGPNTSLSSTCLLLNKIFSNEIRHSKLKPACSWKSCTDQTQPAKNVSFIFCSFLLQVIFLTKLSLYGNRLRKSLDRWVALLFLPCDIAVRWKQKYNWTRHEKSNFVWFLGRSIPSWYR